MLLSTYRRRPPTCIPSWSEEEDEGNLSLDVTEVSVADPEVVDFAEERQPVILFARYCSSSSRWTKFSRSSRRSFRPSHHHGVQASKSRCSTLSARSRSSSSRRVSRRRRRQTPCSNRVTLTSHSRSRRRSRQERIHIKLAHTHTLSLFSAAATDWLSTPLHELGDVVLDAEWADAVHRLSTLPTAEATKQSRERRCGHWRFESKVKLLFMPTTVEKLIC